MKNKKLKKGLFLTLSYIIAFYIGIGFMLVYNHQEKEKGLFFNDDRITINYKKDQETYDLTIINKKDFNFKPKNDALNSEMYSSIELNGISKNQAEKVADMYKQPLKWNSK